MNVIFQLGGRAWAPLLAAPSITGGFFSTADIAHMIVDPEAYCDCTQDQVLSAYKVTQDTRLLSVPRYHLKSFALGADVGDCFDDLVVDVEPLRSIFCAVSQGLAEAGRLSGGIPVWDEKPLLPSSVQQRIAPAIAALLSTDRANSLEVQLDRIRHALAEIAKGAAAAGIDFDSESLPGYKRQLADILTHIDPRISRALETLDRHFKKLGLRWRQGSRPEDAEPLLDLFDLSPKVA